MLDLAASLKKEAARSSEKKKKVTTWRHNPEDREFKVYNILLLCICRGKRKF
jgi:hypothetical protein